MINRWKSTQLLNASVQHENSTTRIELFVQTKNLRITTPQELVQDLEDSTYINHFGKTTSTMLAPRLST